MFFIWEKIVDLPRTPNSRQFDGNAFFPQFLYFNLIFQVRITLILILEHLHPF